MKLKGPNQFGKSLLSRALALAAQIGRSNASPLLRRRLSLTFVATTPATNRGRPPTFNSIQYVARRAHTVELSGLDRTGLDRTGLDTTTTTVVVVVVLLLLLERIKDSGNLNIIRILVAPA